MRKSVSGKTALSGLFLAMALIVSLIENLIPPVVPALPYAKLGLSNVVLLMCFIVSGVWRGYAVLLLKCLLSAVFAGNVSMLMWSLPASFAAYTVMAALYRTGIFSVTGLSALGGMLHNAVQIAVAVGIVGVSVAAYLPYMLLAGGIAGLATGLICHFVLAFIRRGGLIADECAYVREPRAENCGGSPERGSD